MEYYYYRFRPLHWPEAQKKPQNADLRCVIARVRAAKSPSGSFFGQGFKVCGFRVEGVEFGNGFSASACFGLGSLLPRNGSASLVLA